MQPQWPRDLRDGSARFNRAFFMKQMTAKRPIPDDLLVRQFPGIKSRAIRVGDHDPELDRTLERVAEVIR